MTRIFTILLVCASATPLAASDIPVRPSQGYNTHGAAGGPYCGILALYGAMNSEGIPARFEDLVHVKYVGTEDGSTLSELETAARDQGAYALAIEGMTAASLRSCRHPVVLHVRRPGHATEFAHWVLFLGCDGNDALILDAPHAVERIPMPELLAHWDGVGLVISREPISAVSYSWIGWFEGAVLLAALVALFSLLKWRTIQQPAGIVRHAGRFVIVVLVAGCLAVVWHLVYDDGFLTNRTAVEHVAVRYFQPTIETISIDEVRFATQQSDVTIIDVRSPSAFSGGHIPNSINLPISSSLATRRQVLAGIPKHNKLIVYCLSERCEWSQMVAGDLALRGFRKVSVYPGGWVEWERHE